MGGRYQAEVQNLLHSINDEHHRSKSGQILRGLIEKVTLTPDGRNGELSVDLHGDLAGILQISSNEKKISALEKNNRNETKNEKGRLDETALLKMVAGIGFEPMTFRL
jgi:site-specific DNA recombinase